MSHVWPFAAFVAIQLFMEIYFKHKKHAGRRR